MDVGIIIASLYEREVNMFTNKWVSLSRILDESPFYTELSIKERERLIIELLQIYPQLGEQETVEIEVGYEAGWLMQQPR